MIYTINHCAVDTNAYEIRRDGSRIPVEPQVFDLLVLLLENRDRIVTKDEIFDRIWNGRIVSDAALSSRIKAARQAIGDDGGSQNCIRTIRRRGFRVVADVQVSDASPFARDGHAKVAAFKNSSPITSAALGMPTGPAIAVLRFNNLSDDRSIDFFADAIAEEIITELTRFSELRVTAHTLSFEYDGSRTDIGEIGKALGVEFLIQGSLRCAGNRVRVTAHLLKVEDGTLLWAETYERQVTPADIFAVEEDIAGKVVAAIASISTGVIAREVQDRARGKPPQDLSAYECTVRANELMMSGFSAETHRATRDRLEAVVESEPDYAAAWAMLAWTLCFEYTEGYNRRPDRDPLELALAAARRAVELAPGNSMARFAMARVSYLMHDLDLFYAEAANALSLNPHEPFLLGNLGCWLCFSGRWEEGVAMIKKAIALNPKVYPRWWHSGIAKNHYRKGEYREALAEFRKMNLPNWWWNQVELAYTYAQLGDTENARKAVGRLLELYPGFDLATAEMEHRKFSFEQSYIDHAIDGLRKAGVPERFLAASVSESPTVRAALARVR